MNIWALVISVIVASVALLGAVEYRGLTDDRRGGTISEWVNARAQRAGPGGIVLVWVALLASAAALAWHFTAGRGVRWDFWRRKDQS